MIFYYNDKPFSKLNVKLINLWKIIGSLGHKLAIPPFDSMICAFIYIIPPICISSNQFTICHFGTCSTLRDCVALPNMT